MVTGLVVKLLSVATKPLVQKKVKNMTNNYFVESTHASSNGLTFSANWHRGIDKKNVSIIGMPDYLCEKTARKNTIFNKWKTLGGNHKFFCSKSACRYCVELAVLFENNRLTLEKDNECDPQWKRLSYPLLTRIHNNLIADVVGCYWNLLEPDENQFYWLRENGFAKDVSLSIPRRRLRTIFNFEMCLRDVNGLNAEAELLMIMAESIAEEINTEIISNLIGCAWCKAKKLEQVIDFLPQQVIDFAIEAESDHQIRVTIFKLKNPCYTRILPGKMNKDYRLIGRRGSRFAAGYAWGMHHIEATPVYSDSFILTKQSLILKYRKKIADKDGGRHFAVVEK